MCVCVRACAIVYFLLHYSPRVQYETDGSVGKLEIISHHALVSLQPYFHPATQRESGSEKPPVDRADHIRSPPVGKVTRRHRLALFLFWRALWQKKAGKASIILRGAYRVGGHCMVAGTEIAARTGNGRKDTVCLRHIPAALHFKALVSEFVFGSRECITNRH